ncbi:MAG: hypothetical protein JWM27_159 [Gemmatimonadetes bacterium]|nr:hypothetical protein [Gemmatimonadota bacterium]
MGFDEMSLSPASRAELASVDGLEGVAALSADTNAVFLHRPNDLVLAALAARVPGLRHLVTDGNGHELTDRGLAHLAGLRALETLDLEWSSVTDAGLPLLAALPSLCWVDLGGATGVTAEGIARLRTTRPDLEVEALGL